RFRPLALRQASVGEERGARRRRKRHPVGGDPMLWKEVFVETGPRLHWLGRLLVALLVLASFAPAVWIVALYLDEEVIHRTRPFSPAFGLNEQMNLWVRPVGTIVACLLLLGVAVRAAASVGGERDRQTLDSLLTSPLEAGSILYGKWIGSIVSVRWGWLWLGL